MYLPEYNAVYDDQIGLVVLYSSDIGVIPAQTAINLTESVRPIYPGTSGTVPNALLSRLDDSILFSQVNGYPLISMDGPYVAAADIIPALNEASPSELDEIQEALELGPVTGGYLHTQSSASTVWTINHNLGVRPSVQTFTVGGLEMFGDVQHVSNNILTITFAISVAGTARLT